MIAIENRQTDLVVKEDWVIGLAEKILDLTNLKDYDLGIAFVDTKEMGELNQKYLGKQGHTDVLAFPLVNWANPKVQDEGVTDEFYEKPTDCADILGDVVLCPAALEEAKNIHTEVTKLLVHGILHLAGYDHYSPSEKKEMFALQDEIVRQISY